MSTDHGPGTQGNIAYVRHMLGELRAVADSESYAMLCYLTEMAYMEAGDIQLGKQPSRVRGR